MKCAFVSFLCYLQTKFSSIFPWSFVFLLSLTSTWNINANISSFKCLSAIVDNLYSESIVKGLVTYEFDFPDRDYIYDGKVIKIYQVALSFIHLVQRVVRPLKLLRSKIKIKGDMLWEPSANKKSRIKWEADFVFSKMSSLVEKVNQIK